MTGPDRPLALSLGDPAGIGPELACEAWAQRGSLDLPAFFVTGGAAVLAAAARTRGIELPVATIDQPDQAAAAFVDALPVLGGDEGEYAPGLPREAGARLALQSLERATDLVRQRQASALVTMPVSKSELAAVGFDYPGQTEYMAQACGVTAADAVMMLSGPSLRTVPLTVHCSLAEVPRLLTTDLILRKGRIVATALRRDLGIESPRLAVCGLNPHAGESGRIGDEEERVIAPAIEALREEGIEATGPHPADAIFTHRARETYDVALAMYHDQALIPLKALDFDEGVNVTLGLPIVRTSPDHGTAFSIAGEGIADPGATIAAIRMAGDMAGRRQARG